MLGYFKDRNTLCLKYLDLDPVLDKPVLATTYLAQPGSVLLLFKKHLSLHCLVEHHLVPLCTWDRAKQGAHWRCWAPGFFPPVQLLLFSFPKMCQSSPGGQSSCSSEPSPLGSTNNNDSGVEMNMHSGGSLGDLTALDDNAPVVDSTVSSGNSTVSLQLRKHMTTMQRLEQLKKEKLKTVKDSCSWVSPAPQARNTKLPPISGNGKLWAWALSCRTLHSLAQVLQLRVCPERGSFLTASESVLAGQRCQVKWRAWVETQPSGYVQQKSQWHS